MRVRLVGHLAKLLDMFLATQLFFVMGIDFFTSIIHASI
jgi:hypothetical protein